MPDNELKQQAERAFFQAFEQRKRSPGQDAGMRAPDMERMVSLIESHLDQADSKYQVRTTLPGRLERLPLLRIKPIKKIALRIYELLFREQRTAGLAQLNAWRDFLQLYTRNHWFLSHELSRSRDDLQDHLNKVFLHVDQAADKLAARIASQNQEYRRLAQDIHYLQKMEARISHLEDDLRVSRSAVQMQAQWIQFLIDRTSAPAAEPLAASPAAATKPLPAPPTGGSSAARYVAFEDHFRGHPAKVKEQFAQDYLPVLTDAGLKAGAKALDIGCGRGEWLELMREQRFEGRGVDLNPVVCELCQSKQLDVLNDDAVAYMAGQPAGSLDLITAFHLIEHIPAELLDRLIASAQHALRPGGLLILETPNPENFIVGSCNFYNDPTHLNPLPPEPTRFRVQSHGFARVDILRLHPRGNVNYEAIPPGIPAELLERLFVGQDYALIAHR